MASARATGQEQQASLSDAETIARHKREAARSAAGLVQDAMRVGLGTGSTVAYLLEALGERVGAGELRDVRCAA
ncbi:MAG TPA: hypothetical protein VGI27_12295, partial [Solirubrobacteraceae bacterium]